MTDQQMQLLLGHLCLIIHTITPHLPARICFGALAMVHYVLYIIPALKTMGFL